jgi:hypothetical protein
MGALRDTQAGVAGLGELDGGNVRASDRDRNKVADELRAHCADGRITMEEFERRVEQAMAAQTIHDLAEVVHDLPTAIPPDRQQHRAERVRIGPPGIRPFTRRIVVPVPLERTRAIALDTIATGLNGLGYELRRQSPIAMEFERTARERIVIDFERHGTASTTMIVHGRAARSVRKHFAKLDFG